jgi:hypothetical protein
MEVLVFPKVLEKDFDLWKEENIVLLKGRYSEKDGEPKLLCESGVIINERELKRYEKEASNKSSAVANTGFSPQQSKSLEDSKQITIEIDVKTLPRITSLLSQSEKGNSKIYLQASGSQDKLETTYQIKYSEKFLQEVKNVVGSDKVVVS